MTEHKRDLWCWGSVLYERVSRSFRTESI